jgi:hypothetical protein
MLGIRCNTALVPYLFVCGTVVFRLLFLIQRRNIWFIIVTLIRRMGPGAVALAKIASLEIVIKIQFKLAPHFIRNFIIYCPLRIWNFLTRNRIRALELRLHCHQNFYIHGAMAESATMSQCVIIIWH